MGVLDMSFNLVEGSSAAGQVASDGTYIWFTTTNSSTVRKLWRMRISDKALIKPELRFPAWLGVVCARLLQTEHT
jgi:hypothetical protein